MPAGEIRTPDEVRNGDYDLICIGSPTWWRTTNMPMRSFLKSDEARKLLAGKPFAAFVVCRRYWRENFKTVRKLGEKQGGRYVGGVHFEYPGGQISSLLSLTSYLGSGEYRDRYMGLRIPTTNVQPEQLEADAGVRACPRGSVVRSGIGDAGRGNGAAAMRRSSMNARARYCAATLKK